jgi:hydrogenase-4 membrane subunit HyfE
MPCVPDQFTEEQKTTFAAISDQITALIKNAGFASDRLVVVPLLETAMNQGVENAMCPDCFADLLAALLKIYTKKFAIKVIFDNLQAPENLQ